MLGLQGENGTEHRAHKDTRMNSREYREGPIDDAYVGVQNFVLRPYVSVLMQPGCHFSTVHVSPEGINCCELNDSSVVFLQPLVQRRRRSGDKWEVVFQSVFISLWPIAVHITLPLSFSQHTSLPLLPFCSYVCVSVTVMQQVLVGNRRMPF